MNVTKIQISLTKISDIKNLIAIVTKMNNVIDVVQGRHSVDAKSLIGVLSLNMDKPMVLHIYGDVDKSFLYLLENLNEQGVRA